MDDTRSYLLPQGIIPITDPDSAIDFEAVNGLFANGCQLLHLRKPSWTLDQLRGWCANIQADYRHLLTLHGPTLWARELGCGGVHGQSTTPVGGQPLRQSVSWHQLDEPHAGVDYGFLSPVWPSTSKQGYGPSWEWSEMVAASQRWTGQTVALGGLTPDRCKLAREVGFQAAAVLGWLWSSPDTPSVVHRWRELEMAWFS